MASIISAGTTSGTSLNLSGDTSGVLQLASNGSTTAVTVNTSQGVSVLNCLGVGNATPSTSGAGITFPASQSASSDANTLDDYEEGTWTPTLNRLSTSPTIVYNARGGLYTKTGRFIYLSGFINWTTNTGGSGTYVIGGLPFTVLNNAGAYPQLLTTDFEGIDFPSGYTTFGGYGNINTTNIILVCGGDNVSSTVPNAVNNTGYIYFNLMYQVA